MSKKKTFASIHSIVGINQRRFAVRRQIEEARKRSKSPEGYHLNQNEIGGNHKPKHRYASVSEATAQLSRCNGGIKSFGAADYIAKHKAK
jgi:hypothetical protein